MFGTKKSKSKKPRKRKLPKARATREIFHGVAIEPGPEGPCQAVVDLVNVRYLADDAPMLPLNECSNPRGCNCTYQHFNDRRTQPRRESDVGLPVKDRPNEFRSGFGRRITDG